ncbi:hypothetical protein Y1Q_0017914 [Alligator mississippiensis]|uniref:Uncharacterized protein n=1 Tax=Alligator mississippiensis TaxID=8496 RepID=A0A151MXN8_ALLMI|nr:hypothetical protein Y1Q_0017914 [Alligator mississippiensis]
MDLWLKDWTFKSLHDSSMSCGRNHPQVDRVPTNYLSSLSRASDHNCRWAMTLKDISEDFWDSKGKITLYW